MTRLRLKNRAHQENPLTYQQDRRTARVEVFKRKELFVSRQERRGSRISTFVNTVPELAQEVARIHADLRREGVFVIIEIGSVPPDEEIGALCQPLSDAERREFTRMYIGAKG